MNYTTNERERHATFSNADIARPIGVFNCIDICCSSVPNSELGNYKQRLTPLDYFERFCDQERYKALHMRLKSRYDDDNKHDGESMSIKTSGDERQQLIT